MRSSHEACTGACYGACLTLGQNMPSWVLKLQASESTTDQQRMRSCAL